MTNDFGDLNVPYRLLLGPGPSLVHPRVYRAMAQPVIGLMDPVFLQLLDDTQRPLRTAFRTENDFTMAISGTGTAGMEAAIYNVVEPGDTVVICQNGYFGMRMDAMARRCGAEVVTVVQEWGKLIEPEQVEAALKDAGRVKVVAIVHGETSTGVLQPLEEISRITHEHGALLLVDAVTSLAGCELRIDDWGIDICYSGTQKCLSAPPGMAPLTMSAQAMEAVKNRSEPARSWYLDISMLQAYWGGGNARAYHHTPPMTMLYALREGLRIVLEEGLEPRIARHLRNARAFWAGVEAMGLKLHVAEEHRLTPLTTVRVPEGIDEMELRQGLLMEHNIEIGRGFGALEGQVWRIGLMGYGSSEENVFALLYALETQLANQKFGLDRGAGVAVAARAFAKD
ncbi:MAG TPA: alanine--glyoxylate aminotransferase family protein [Dehalococcoidia bacterium]|nr:alanine--glyoxylate aminotransferase family protein [Dehalococcoidia bacterium]